MCPHKNRGKGKRKESRRPQTPLLFGETKGHTGQWPQGKSSSINQEMNTSWIQMHRSSFTILIVVELSLQDQEVQGNIGVSVYGWDRNGRMNMSKLDVNR